MNPSYFRIKVDLESAISRLEGWNKKAFFEKKQVEYSNAAKEALDENGQWKGSCLYAYENEGWSVFEDLSGFYTSIPAESWQSLAGDSDLVVAGYNDAMPYGEMIVIQGGEVHKEFWDYPEDNDLVNLGNGYPEIESWEDVADFIEEDDLVYSDEGVLLIS